MLLKNKGVFGSTGCREENAGVKGLTEESELQAG